MPGPTMHGALATATATQLELPVLFYLVVIVSLLTNKVSAVMVALAWLFVLLRIVHAAIHVTNNDVPRRFFAFAGGVLTVSVMWLMVMARIILEGV